MLGIVFLGFIHSHHLKPTYTKIYTHKTHIHTFSPEYTFINIPYTNPYNFSLHINHRISMLQKENIRELFMKLTYRILGSFAKFRVPYTEKDGREGKIGM